MHVTHLIVVSVRAQTSCHAVRCHPRPRPSLLNFHLDTDPNKRRFRTCVYISPDTVKPAGLAREMSPPNRPWNVVWKR